MFYDNFERICSERGTSPSGCLVALGKSRSLASAWKRLGTIPRPRDLKAIAEYLHCDIKDLFKNKEGLLTDEAAYRAVMDEIGGEPIPEDGNIAEFIKIYNACNTRQKVQLMNAVFDFEDKVLSAEQEY